MGSPSNAVHWTSHLFLGGFCYKSKSKLNHYLSFIILFSYSLYLSTFTIFHYSLLFLPPFSPFSTSHFLFLHFIHIYFSFFFYYFFILALNFISIHIFFSCMYAYKLNLLHIVTHMHVYSFGGYIILMHMKFFIKYVTIS